MIKRGLFVQKLVEKNRFAEGVFAFILVLVMMSTGTMLSVQAETDRSISGSRNTTGSVLRESLRPTGTVRVLRPVATAGNSRKDRLHLKERLVESNRLALELGTLKKKAQDWSDAARLKLRRVVKNKADLTGDQLVALKDVSAQLQGQKEKIADQDKVIREIRGRLTKLRASGQYAEAAAVVDELIIAQKAMMTTLRESGASVTHISEIIGKK